MVARCLRGAAHSQRCGAAYRAVTDGDLAQLRGNDEEARERQAPLVHEACVSGGAATPSLRNRSNLAGVPESQLTEAIGKRLLQGVLRSTSEWGEMEHPYRCGAGATGSEADRLTQQWGCYADDARHGAARQGKVHSAGSNPGYRQRSPSKMTYLASMRGTRPPSSGEGTFACRLVTARVATRF